MAFDEYGPADVGPHHLHHGVKPFAVPHLQATPFLPGKFNEFVGFRQGHRDRLLDKDMFAGRQACLRHGIMRRGGHRDADEIDVRQKFIDRAEGAGPMPVGDQLGPFDRVIGDTDELRPRQGGIQARMVLPEMSHADHAGS